MWHILCLFPVVFLISLGSSVQTWNSSAMPFLTTPSQQLSQAVPCLKDSEAGFEGCYIPEDLSYPECSNITKAFPPCPLWTRAALAWAKKFLAVPCPNLCQRSCCTLCWKMSHLISALQPQLQLIKNGQSQLNPLMLRPSLKAIWTFSY